MSLIKQTLDAYAASSNRVFASDRMNTVGASEVGQCARKVFWVKNENDSVLRAPRDEEYVDSWGARARGTIYENHFWEPALRERFGDRLLYAGAEQKTLVNGFLSATPDGLLIGLTAKECAESGLPDTHTVLVECKTADSRTNLTEAKTANVFQTQVQMGLMRESTIHEPTHAVLSYTDASFWSDVKEFVIAFDERIYKAAKERAMIIMTATSAADLKPEGWIAGGKECNYCPFTKACGIERRNLPFQDIAPVDPQFAEEITQLALELKRHERAAVVSENHARSYQEIIKSRLREKGVKKIPGVVSWSSVKGRSGYDNKAIKDAAVEAGVDIEQFKTQGEPSDRLVIQIGPSDDVPMPGATSVVA